jgi:hypothetical protein
MFFCYGDNFLWHFYDLFFILRLSLGLTTCGAHWFAQRLTAFIFNGDFIVRHAVPHYFINTGAAVL